MALAEIKDRAFVDKQFFIVNFSDGSIERLTFTELSGLKLNISEKQHKESGSPIPWIGAGTVTYDNITMARGLGLNLPKTQGGVIDRQLNDWADAAVNGVDNGGQGGAGSYKKTFTIKPQARNGDGYGFKWVVEDAVAVSYEPFSGDANSDDVAIETLECKPSRWFLDDTAAD